MSTAAPPTPGPDASPEELARLIRDGLEAGRWPMTPPARPAPPLPPDAPELGPVLLPFSSPLGHPAAAGPGRLRKPVRLIRGVLKVFLRPWFDLQTRFNHKVMEALEREQRRLGDHLKDLAEYLREQQDAVRRLNHRVNDGLYQTQARFDELADRLRAEFGAPRPEPRPAVPIGERVLESIFVHTRLPAPPARLLDLGAAGALEMASLGFQVVGVDVRHAAARHSNLQVVEAPRHRLPFPDGAFDVAVAASAFGAGRVGEGDDGDDLAAAAEVFRALRPGGRFILTVPLGRGYDLDKVDQLLVRFRRVETAYGVRDGEEWSFTTDAGRAAADGAGAVALLVAEKP
jgi:SAM-dependent methyltransferase